MSGAARNKKTPAPAPKSYDLSPGPTITDEARERLRESLKRPATAPIELTPGEAWDVRGLVEQAAAAQRDAEDCQQRAQAIAARAAQRAGVEFSGAFRIDVDHEAGAVFVRKVDPE